MQQMPGRDAYLDGLLVPIMERLGITTAAELQGDTLAERLQDELRAANGIVISPPMIGAWARVPE